MIPCCMFTGEMEPIAKKVMKVAGKGTKNSAKKTTLFVHEKVMNQRIYSAQKNWCGDKREEVVVQTRRINEN